MAYTNYKKSKETNTRIFPAIVAMLGLFMAGGGYFLFRDEGIAPTVDIHFWHLYYSDNRGLYLCQKKSSISRRIISAI
jgi:hypothetical protein